MTIDCADSAAADICFNTRVSIRRVADLEAAVAQSTRQRRELHNQLVELRGNVRLPTRFLTSHLFHSYLRIPTSDLQACNQQGNSKGPPEQ